MSVADVRYPKADPCPPPHRTPAECDRWVAGSVAGCPHISVDQLAGLMAERPAPADVAQAVLMVLAAVPGTSRLTDVIEAGR